MSETTFKIILWPDPRLKKVSEKVTTVNPKLVSEMFAAMDEAGGVGLSAIQIGFPVRVVVANIGGQRRTFLNPRWIDVEDSKMRPVLEGCLSTPGMFETVYRYDKVLVDYDVLETKTSSQFLTQYLRPETLMLDGLWAQMIQHECEHLDGKMFVDNLKKADRSRIMGEMVKLKRSGSSR
jgi:peptide deformylase